MSNLLNALSYGGLLFLVGSGLTITFGLMRAVNLAHGGFYLIGGYISYDLVTRGHSYAVSLLVGVALTVLLGMLVERVLLHPIVNQELPQIVVTIGVGLIIGDQIFAHYGGVPISPPTPEMFQGPINVGQFTFPMFRVMFIVLALVVAGLVAALLRFTSIGARVRAAVDDEAIARSVGIRVPLIFMLVFGLGSGLAAFAGFWGGALTSLEPGQGFEVLLLAIVVVVVGGLGSMAGALLGAFGVGILDQFGRVLFPEWSMFTIYLVVAVFLAFRPQGLLGKAEVHV